MRKRLIYICSPLRGDIEKNIQKAQGYCREAVDLWPDVIPIAPHVYCTQFLDDTIPQEREAGMELGIALLDMCDELWVYGINNPSEGMKKEIAYAKEHGIPVKDAADLYRLREQEKNRQEDKELGDALLPRSLVFTLFRALSEKAAMFFWAAAPYWRTRLESVTSIFWENSSTIFRSASVSMDSSSLTALASR